MRKLKLLFAALALLVGGAGSASAQTDVTDKITNPNFSTDANGWTITGPARSFNGTGFDGDKFIELTNWGSSWDATISQTVSNLDNGYYRVKAAGQMSGASDCWMKLVANGAENFFSRNGDTNGNILANGTETAINSGVAGWRYSSVIAKVTNGTLEISCIGHSDVKERWANFDHVTLTYLGESIPADTDVSDFINNWDFWGCFNSAFNGWTIETTGGNTWVHGNTAVEFWNDNLNQTFDYHQTITNLAKGKYEISASMWNTQGAPNGNTGVYGTNSEDATVFAGVTDDCDDNDLHTYTTNEIVVKDGTLRIGVKNNGDRSSNWFGVDWIKLTYKEPFISEIATEIPAATATALTADKWYKFTPVSNGDHSFDATTNIGDVIYTTTDQLPSTVTGTATATATMALTDGTTYYIKSSSAQTLTITPQTFTYTVGDGTPSVADTKYTQVKSFTLTFENASTDDPNGEFQILDASKITVNSVAATASLTNNVLTITLADALAASTDYVINVDAGAIGYKADAANAAISLTVHTPAVFDGTYYLYDDTSAKFLSRGKNHGSRAVVDLYGIPFNLTTDADNVSTIQFVDWAGKYLFKTGSTIYTDNASTGWKFVESSDKYYLKTADDAYYAYVTEDIVDPTDAQASATLWTVKSKAERDAIVNAYPTTNKTNVITAASLTSETNAAGFEAYLAANYAAEDKTASVGTAKFTGSAGDWTWTLTSNNTGNATYGTDWTEAFQTGGTWSQTITGLPSGIYKVTVNGFERKAGYALCNTLAAEGYQPVTAYFKANNEQLALKSWYSDKTGESNPNNTGEAATAFNNDKYKNTIYTYVADESEGKGSLTLTIGKQDKVGGSWVLFNNVTLTYYNNSLSDEQKTAIAAEATTEMAKPMKPSLYQALSSAKTTFEGSQTVPNYNALRTAIDNTATSVASYAAMNTNYLKPIAALLASSNIIDQTSSAYTDYVTTKAKYDNYTNAQTADIDNADANALTLWQGNGARYTNVANILMTTGWQIGGADALTDGSGFYANTWSTENAGTAPAAADFARPFYEMWVSSGSIAAATLTRTITGLTANAVYAVNANVRVQYDNKVDGSITMKAGSGAAVDVTAGSKIGDTKRYIDAYTAIGQADGDGKLTITFTVAENSGITWLAFRDIVLKKAAPESITVTAAGYATYVSDQPLDFTSTEIKAYTAKVNAGKVVLTQINKVPANTPVVLYKEGGATESIPVATTTDTPAASDLVAGTGAAVATDGGTGYTNYILNNVSGIGFYLAAGQAVAKNRAYLHVDNANKTAAPALTIVFDGETTDIKGIYDSNIYDLPIYDLQGRKVAKPTKGLYIVNGRKVIVK